MGILDALMPILIFFVKVIDIASRPIEFLADVISWLAGWISALGQFILYIVTFQWNKLKKVSTPGAFKSDAFTRPLIKIEKYRVDTTIDTIEIGDLGTVTTPAAEAVNTGAVGTTASNYQVQNLTLYITVNTDVITGEGGVPELVRILYREFQGQLANGTI
jgi:hypothetical protein